MKITAHAEGTPKAIATQLRAIAANFDGGTNEEETIGDEIPEDHKPEGRNRGRPRNAVKAAAVEETYEDSETSFEDDTPEEDGGEEDPPLSKYTLATVKKALKAYVMSGKTEQERAKKFLKKCGAGHIDDLSPKYFAEAIKTFQ
jgi:hypothetical protein